MPEATVMDSIETSATDLRDKLVNLTKSLSETEKDKKAAMKSYNDAIKDIKEEIKLTLDLLEGGGNEQG